MSMKQRLAFLANRFRCITCSFILLFILSGLGNIQAETISIVADEWPPFNGKAGSDNEGYMIDIAREVFKEKGIQVDYKNIPWKRALKEVRSGSFTSVVGASKSDAEGFIFPGEELTRNYLAFYVLKENDWKYENPASVNSISIGVIGGYDYRKWLNNYIKSHKNNYAKVQIMHGQSPLMKNLNKLLYKRIDVVVDNEAAIRSVAKKMGILSKIKPAGYGKKASYCYIAFSPALEKSGTYAEILSEGIRKMRTSGKLQKILDRYGLIDWKK